MQGVKADTLTIYYKKDVAFAEKFAKKAEKGGWSYRILRKGSTASSPLPYHQPGQIEVGGDEGKPPEDEDEEVDGEIRDAPAGAEPQEVGHAEVEGGVEGKAVVAEQADEADQVEAAVGGQAVGKRGQELFALIIYFYFRAKNSCPLLPCQCSHLFCCKPGISDYLAYGGSFLTLPYDYSLLLFSCYILKSIYRSRTKLLNNEFTYLLVFETPGIIHINTFRTTRFINQGLEVF